MPSVIAIKLFRNAYQTTRAYGIWFANVNLI